MQARAMPQFADAEQGGRGGHTSKPCHSSAGRGAHSSGAGGLMAVQPLPPAAAPVQFARSLAKACACCSCSRISASLSEQSYVRACLTELSARQRSSALTTQWQKPLASQLLE